MSEHQSSSDQRLRTKFTCCLIPWRASLPTRSATTYTPTTGTSAAVPAAFPALVNADRVPVRARAVNRAFGAVVDFVFMCVAPLLELRVPRGTDLLAERK